MIATILKIYWKPLLILVLAVVLTVGCRVIWVIYGDVRYSAGYAQAKIDQRKADDEEMQRRDKEKTTNEREAQKQIDKVRTDALDSASRAGRLQQQLATIRKQLREYNIIVGAGSSASETGILLADVLSKSIERNRQLAEYADRAAEAGRVCEKQYDSLRK